MGTTSIWGLRCWVLRWCPQALRSSTFIEDLACRGPDADAWLALVSLVAVLVALAIVGALVVVADLADAWHTRARRPGSAGATARRRSARGALSTDTVPTAARGFVTIDTEGSKDGSDPGRDETVPSDDRAVGRFPGRSNL